MSDCREVASILLDDAASALESEAEAAIQETQYGMMEGETIISFSQGLSAIARRDRIAVLDAARVAKDGEVVA